MADGAGQALIKGLDIDKVSKDMLEEASIFKNEVKNETTSSREIRWYQKTSGLLTATTPAKILKLLMVQDHLYFVEHGLEILLLLKNIY